MTVTIVILGVVLKLAIAVAVTYRTRVWWVPGALSIAVGAAACLFPGMTRLVGEAMLGLGTTALAVARMAVPAVR